MYSSNANARSRMGGEQLTIMFEHFTDQSYRCGADLGSGSGRSSPSTSLPCTPVDLFPHSPLDVALAEEDSWNLIPYDVPWGPEYYHYRAGTLPGPEGACIFLRSPTPFKNRHTQKACNKCRQRKARCSGSRPTCTRCITRGYVCEYVEEDKRTPPQNATRGRRQRTHSECSSESAETADSLSDCDSSDYIQPKEEPSLSTAERPFADPDAHAHSPSSAGYHHQAHDAHYSSLVTAYEYDGVGGDTYAGHEPVALCDYYEHAPYAEGARAHFSSPPVGPSGSAAQMYHEATDPHGAAASVHAPRPLLCRGSPAFLMPEEHQQLVAFAAAADAHTHAHAHGHQVHAHGHGHHAHGHGHHAHARGLAYQNDPILISLAAADEGASQMALLEVPLMPLSTDPALDAGTVEYAQQQDMYYYPGAGEPAMQFRYLHYQYGVQTYSPTASSPEDLEPGLYAMPMPMLPVGMMA